MAILINGNGNPAIYPDQDADWFASIFGGQTAITGVGSQFAAEIEDANTIAVADGVIITKEGRRIQLDANQSDIFDIPTGAQGTTNYYIIGYCLTTNDDSSQTAETFVQLMENATDTIEEDTFRDGADKVYVSLYRVTQTGFTLDTPELLLPKVESITQLNADLSGFSFRVNGGVPEFSVDGGITWNNLGGGSGRVVKYGTGSGTSTISLGETIDPSKYYVILNTGSFFTNSNPGQTCESWGDGAYISAKTSTSFTVTFNRYSAPFSYQVIAFE